MMCLQCGQRYGMAWVQYLGCSFLTKVLKSSFQMDTIFVYVDKIVILGLVTKNYSFRAWATKLAINQNDPKLGFPQSA